MGLRASLSILWKALRIDRHYLVFLSVPVCNVLYLVFHQNLMDVVHIIGGGVYGRTGKISSPGGPR